MNPVGVSESLVGIAMGWDDAAGFQLGGHGPNHRAAGRIRIVDDVTHQGYGRLLQGIPGEKFREEFGGITCEELQKKFTGKTYDMWNAEEYASFDKNRGFKCAHATGTVTKWVVEMLWLSLKVSWKLTIFIVLSNKLTNGDCLRFCSR